MYKKFFKPILFLFSPDKVHNMIVAGGRLAQATVFGRMVIRKMWRTDRRALEQNILGIDFKNPVGLSAGFDKNVQLTALMESVGFGFATGGSVTMLPRKGNPRPWFYRLPKTQSLVVHAGMANKGLEVIEENIQKNQPRLKHLPLSLSVAVVARDSTCTLDQAIEDTIAATEYILEHNLAQMIEINISCPNAGDSQPFSRVDNLENLLQALDQIPRDLPFFIKMPLFHDLDEFDQLLQVITRHNIQGVTIANLEKDRSQVDLKDNLSDQVKGGLSGAPTREASLRLIRHTYQNYGQQLVIIGVGGIFNAQEAYDKIKAGASLVAMITGMIFEGPQIVGKINQDLAKMLQNDGFTSIAEAVGSEFKK